MRVCLNQARSDQDFLIEQVYLYIQCQKKINEDFTCQNNMVDNIQYHIFGMAKCCTQPVCYIVHQFHFVKMVY